MRVFKHLTLEVMIRVVADVAIVNLAYMWALMLRLLWRMATRTHLSAQPEIAEALRIYGETFWLLTLIVLVVYSLSGFYSRGRFYRSRFKALVIVQAVSLAYILFGFALYLSLARDSWMLHTPRSALFLGWALTLGMTTGVRWLAKIWHWVLKRETPALRGNLQRDDRIQHVLVIGGAGYIGSVLCRELLQRGYSVRVLDALLYGQESLAELVQHPRFQLVEGDSRDVSAVFRAMMDMDAVVHLGELVGDPACALDEKLTLEINLAATRMVAEAAQGCGVKRFVYASSCSVYGASDELLDERSVLKPVSLYARAKIGAEHTLLGLNGPDFHPVILRFATVFGLSPRPRFDLVINLLTAKAVCEGEIPIFGGDQWRPFVHVADVARAIVRCLEAPLPSVKARVFNVGGDEQNHTIAQVGDVIQRTISGAQILKYEDSPDPRNYHVSFARIRRELGFVPRYTVEDGIRQIATALQSEQIMEYQNKRYSNHKTLSDPGNLLSARSRHLPEFYAPTLPESGVESLPTASA